VNHKDIWGLIGCARFHIANEARACVYWNKWKGGGAGHRLLSLILYFSGGIGGYNIPPQDGESARE